MEVTNGTRSINEKQGDWTSTFIYGVQQLDHVYKKEEKFYSSKK